MKNRFFQLSSDTSTFGEKAASWWMVLSVYFLHLSIHVIRRLDWLCGWIPGFSHLHRLEAVSCWRRGTEVGGKSIVFFRLTKISFKTTSARRRPYASLNHHKHS